MMVVIFVNAHASTSEPLLAPYVLKYGKCSKILNNFLFLFSNTVLVFRVGTHKMLARMANREEAV